MAKDPNLEKLSFMGLPINQYINSLRAAVKADRGLKVILFSIGNPEPKYAGTRHNAGHLVVQRLTSLFGGLEDRGETSSVSFGTSNGCKNLIFAQSKEFMNTSSQALKDLHKKLPVDSHVIVVHDDMELAPGDVKFKLATNSFRGHNGLRDLARLGSFARMRVGIGPPPSMDSKAVSRYVLGKMPIVQRDFVEHEGVEKAYEMVESIVKVFNKKFERVPPA